MKVLPKCLLLPIDGTRESLKPGDFLSRLYPVKSGINLIICYFIQPLSPIYKEKSDSPDMARKKQELLRSREKNTRMVMDEAKKVLMKAGFLPECIHELVEEKEVSAPQQACLVGGMRKVDAVVVQKRSSADLEGFFKEDPIRALLHHCHSVPLWLIEGNVDPSQASICIQNEETSLRAADHAAFMLAETSTGINLLHAARSIFRPTTVPAFSPSADVERWLLTDAGKDVAPFLRESREIVKKAGIDEERIQMTLLPSRGNVAEEILSYCKGQGIGIVVIGHSNPTGKWGFLKSSVTKKALAEFRNMAIWVNQ